MTRRGQAALEYLVTYGWGFVAILVVLSSLMYFDMLNPTRYLPERCDFGSQLECVDVRLDTQAGQTGNLCIQFRNNFGEAIVITHMWVPDGTDGVATGRWWWDGPASSWVGLVSSPQTTTQGNITEVLRYRFNSPSVEIFNGGDRVSVPVIITFRRSVPPTSPLHNVTGEIYATVQDGAFPYCGFP